MSESRRWLAHHGYIAKTPNEHAKRLKGRLLHGDAEILRSMLETIKEYENVNSWDELERTRRYTKGCKA